MNHQALHHQQPLHHQQQQSRFLMPPSILRRSKKIPLNESNTNIKVDKNDSGVFFQQLGFSPSAFLNMSDNTSGGTSETHKPEMMTSTPAKDCPTFQKSPSIKITPVCLNNKADAMSSQKRKSSHRPNWSTNHSEQKKPLLSPRTPTPLRSAPKKKITGVSKQATIDEISNELMKKPNSSLLTTPDHDYAKLTFDTTSDISDFTGTSKTALRRTLFETPCSNPMVRPPGVNLFTEKELNAIEQMSTCFTPRKDVSSIDKHNEKQFHLISSSNATKAAPVKTEVMQLSSSSQHLHGQLITCPQQQQQQQQQPQSSTMQRHQIRILPLVGKPLKIPIRRLPPRNLRFSEQTEKRCNTSSTQNDAFKTVAFGQSHDQKFLTEQARLIMKEINQAARF